VTLTATVTSKTPGRPSGTVAFRSGETALGEAALSDGAATLVTATLPVGSQTITAAYAGDRAFAPSSGSATHVVERAPTTLVLASSVNPPAVGQPVTFTATVTPAGGGMVAFLEGDRSLGAAAVDPSGKASITVATLGGGAHTITANYPGDASFAPSSRSLNQVVARAPTNTAMITSPNPSAPGEAVTLVATVNSTDGMPTGAVSFWDGDTLLGEAPIEGGRASLSTTTLAAGGHELRASYGGTRRTCRGLARSGTTWSRRPPRRRRLRHRPEPRRPPGRAPPQVRLQPPRPRPLRRSPCSPPSPAPNASWSSPDQVSRPTLTLSCSGNPVLSRRWYPPTPKGGSVP